MSQPRLPSASSAPPVSSSATDGRTEVYDVVRKLANRTPAPTGCPVQGIKVRLSAVGLRPTRQRILLGWLLFGQSHRHVSAEELFEEAARARAHLSLATVYNTLRQFSEAGLIRQVPTGGGKAYFDTNVAEHHHYLVEGEDLMWDAPGEAVPIAGNPVAPPGYTVVGVDVVVRLKRLTPPA